MNGFSILGAAGLLDGSIQLHHDETWGDGDFIPKNVRRRISRLIAQVLRVTYEAGGMAASEDAAMIFATANGEINTIGAILQALLAVEPQVSPTLFHNSVHNAAPGYWAILAKRLAASTTLTMGVASFEAAMLEAWMRLSDGESEVQVSVGDEAITGAPWADPAHCTVDFAGSFRVGCGTEPGLGRLALVEFVPEEPDGFDEMARAQVLGATEVVCDPMTVPGGAMHPCAGAAVALSFLLRPGDAGRLLLVRRSPAGGRFILVFDRGVHD
jgi:hypothetical protein